MLMEQMLEMLPSRSQPLLVRYGVTTALVGLSILLLMGLQGRGGVLGFYLLFRRSSLLLSYSTAAPACSLHCLQRF